MGNHFDVIVAGVGGMGSAACFALAKRGKRVLGLEQFDIPHTRGSSHGHTRIIRLAYYEHPSYVHLLKRAYELFHEIEAHTGEQVLHYTGSIDAGPADSSVFSGALLSATQFDLPHEVLTSAELTQRFPGYRFPRDHMALFQPQGGFLLPERCIVNYVNAALALGADVHGRERVLAYEPTPSGGVRVRTDRITAGAWDDRLVPHLRGLAVPERQVLAWLRPLQPDLFRPDTFPVFNALLPEGRFYGFPQFGIPGFKFGKYHHFEETGDPDTLIRGDGGEPRPDDEAMLRDFATQYFPDAAGPTLTLVSCMFTNTPDGHFIIDMHPELPQVVYASPCSGHGFKFTSVIGEILAELAVDERTRWDISLFRADRFNLKSEI
ncbi:MAG: N-methyl-L-tryptophan oxidase [Chloroflexi bacterium]|nr:N-methyl-L-tryptophan oxidase [Chloroflexota bacterium]